METHMDFHELPWLQSLNKYVKFFYKRSNFIKLDIGTYRNIITKTYCKTKQNT